MLHGPFLEIILTFDIDLDGHRRGLAHGRLLEVGHVVDSARAERHRHQCEFTSPQSYVHHTDPK